MSTEQCAAEIGMDRTAVISGDGLYRYELTRRWDDRPLALWVMLNPSTADGLVDDPTLESCMRKARLWNCGGVAVVNLYAFRSPDPKDLTSIADAVGPENVTYLEKWLSKPTDEVLWAIAGWGDSLPPHRPHPPVLLIADRLGRELYCLGRTRKGRPRHPLYLADDTKRELLR